MSDGRASSPSAPDQTPARPTSAPSAPMQQAMSDPSSRRALLLQALLARQQPTGRGAAGSPLGGSVGSIGSPASPGSGGSPTVPLPDVPLAPALSHVLPSRPAQTGRGDSIPLGLSLGEGALSEALMTGNWDQVVQGLDAAAEEGDSHHQPNKPWTDGGVSNEQLDQAQKALEAWANTHKPLQATSNPYQSHHQSPIQPPPPPSHYVGSSSPALSSSNQSPAPFPWAALYPHTASQPTPLGGYHSLSVPHNSSNPQSLNTAPYYTTSDPPTRSQSFSGELPSITPPNGAATTTATTKKGKGGGKKGPAKKAVANGATAAAGEAAERAAEEESARVAQANMTPEEIEEDKRRRNTYATLASGARMLGRGLTLLLGCSEASARFRAKKKQRDAELNQTTAQLRQRVSDLEAETASVSKPL